MENTDTEFYEKIDKQIAEILTPTRETPEIIIEAPVTQPVVTEVKTTKANNMSKGAFGFQIDFKASYDMFMAMPDNYRKSYLEDKYHTLMIFIKSHHGKFKKQKGDKDSGLKFAHKCGEMGAEIIILFLATKGCVYLSKGNDNRYDFIMLRGGKETMMELKTDTKHMLSGYNEETNKFEGESYNVFFETAGRDGKSGIRVTESPVFITYFPIIDEMYISDTATVLKHFMPFLDGYDKHKNVKPADSNMTYVEDGIKFHWKSGDPNSGTKGFLVNRIKHKKDFFTYIAKPLANKTLYPIKKKEEIKQSVSELQK